MCAHRRNEREKKRVFRVSLIKAPLSLIWPAAISGSISFTLFFSHSLVEYLRALSHRPTIKAWNYHALAHTHAHTLNLVTFLFALPPTFPALFVGFCPSWRLHASFFSMSLFAACVCGYIGGRTEGRADRLGLRGASDIRQKVHLLAHL